MVRTFLLFGCLFGLIFCLIWAASFTNYFDKARVRKIGRVFAITAGAILIAFAVITFLFALEHTVF